MADGVAAGAGTFGVLAAEPSNIGPALLVGSGVFLQPAAARKQTIRAREARIDTAAYSTLRAGMIRRGR
jgi:hypothetical protein